MAKKAPQMIEPSTPEGIWESHQLLRSDPRAYVETATGWIENNPSSSAAYFSRHQGWIALGDPERALADMTKSIELEADQVGYRSRGNVYRRLGEYEKAVEDYRRGAAMDPKRWEEDAFPLIYQADTYARLGDEAKALDCCARLPEDFWTPGHNGLPPGGKAEIAAELKRRAAAARGQGV